MIARQDVQRVEPRLIALAVGIVAALALAGAGGYAIASSSHTGGAAVTNQATPADHSSDWYGVDDLGLAPRQDQNTDKSEQTPTHGLLP